jgi:hypothetical protein
LSAVNAVGCSSSIVLSYDSDFTDDVERQFHVTSCCQLIIIFWRCSLTRIFVVKRSLAEAEIARPVYINANWINISAYFMSCMSASVTGPAAAAAAALVLSRLTDWRDDQFSY